LSVGRLIEFKGFQHLINAASLLKARGLDVEVRIIGEGPWRGELEPHIEASGLGASFQLLGVRSQQQIKRELAEAHAFVLPSIVDSKGASDILPTVITEAMACRLPVVSTKLAGIPEMVADGETGLLVEPGDDHALADTIAKLAADPALRKRLGEAGRLRAEKLFALSVTAGELAAKLKSLFGDQASACQEEDGDNPKVELRTTPPPVVFLVSHSQEPLRPLAFLPRDERMRVLIAERSRVERVSGATSLPHEWDAPAGLAVEWIPDAVVLESLWLRRGEWRQEIERCRAFIGEAMDGESFYAQARRAVWLAEALPKRGVRHLHAYTSDDVAAVWIWKKLTGLQASAAIEEAPKLSRVMLGRLLSDFDVASVSDEKLVRSVDSGLGDFLDLQRPPPHREFRFGPLRMKMRRLAPVANRKSLERAWLERILSSLHV
jgi:hypothetical protein